MVVGLICTILLFTIPGPLFAAPLTATTTLTVVNVTRNQYGSVITGEDVTKWSSWPYTGRDGKAHLQLKNPDDFAGDSVRMDDAKVDRHIITWDSEPFVYPWRVLVSPSLNAMICSVFSEDDGKTFTLISWDYLTSSSHYIHLETPFPDHHVWIGTMVHSFCGFEGYTSDKCNGTYRTNLMFEAYP
jgi:hypothetical protein